MGVASSNVSMSRPLFCGLELPSFRRPSPDTRGMTWKCAWKTICPASCPLFCRMFTPVAPEACCTARASRGSSLRTFAATASGMSITVAYPLAFGINSACPGAIGKTSRKATACSVSKILKHGIFPSTIFLKTAPGGRAGRGGRPRSASPRPAGGAEGEAPGDANGRSRPPPPPASARRGEEDPPASGNLGNTRQAHDIASTKPITLRGSHARGGDIDKS